MAISVRLADLSNDDDAASVLEMTNMYSSDPAGAGSVLESDVQKALLPAMRTHPGVRVLLAFEEQRPIGIATCILSFSTFKAAPVLNIHDLAVSPEVRGQGVSRILVQSVEDYARKLGCCKVTLEVSDTNPHAQKVYKALGFEGTGADITRFCTKWLD